MTLVDGRLVQELVKFDVYLVQNYRETARRLWLGKWDTAGMHMTIAEAITLRVALSSLIAATEAAR